MLSLVPASLSCPSVVGMLVIHTVRLSCDCLHKAALSKLKCCTPNFCPGLGLLPPLSHPMQLPDLWQVPCSAALPQLLLSFSSFCAQFLPGRSLLLSVTHQQWPEHVIFLICGQSSSSANAAAVGSAFKPSLFQGFGWQAAGRLGCSVSSCHWHRQAAFSSSRLPLLE